MSKPLATIAMTEQHRASPADWLLHAASLDDADSSCIRELRSRIEALEAAQLEAPMTELRAASAEARPAGGLVERVAGSIWKTCDLGTEARAAIRVVAAAARDAGLTAAAKWLELEADRG